MKIGIVIVNYYGEKNTQECLESLSGLQTQHEVLTVLVNNGSEKNSTFNIQHSKLEFEQIDNKENLGFSGGSNIGIKKALSEGCEYICLLNSDTVVDPHFLDILVKTFQEKSKVGLMSPKIYFAKGYEFHKERYQKNELGKVIWYAGGDMDWQNVLGKHTGVDEVDKGQFDEDSQTDFATGCCLFTSKEVLEKVGLLDEAYFLYYEDADLSERVKKAGYSIWFSAQSLIWHKNAGSAGGSGSELQDYYITRNRLLFAVKYAPVRAKINVLRESWRLLATGRQWQKKAVRDFYAMKFGKGSYGEK